MKKIALIPIDNRPVCYDLPQMTASINKDIKLLLPDRVLLGSLTEKADINGLFDWLEDVARPDYIVISVDTLIYGGLVESRRSNLSKEDIEQRVLRLRNILLKKNEAKTLLFSSIMRISNNNINEEEKEYWKDYGKKIFEYSYNMHRFEVEGSEEARHKAKELSLEIPQDILVDWLLTRERNFLINRMYLKLYDDGLINTLIYSKDDCAKYGFNVKEAEYLELEAQKRKRVYVKTGADEIPLSLLARCVAEGKKIKIAPFYTNPESNNLISNYEDISVKQSVESQILSAGGHVSEIENADIILYVNNFREKQGELVMNVETEGFSGEIKDFDKPCVYADIVNANGSDNKFVEKLFAKGTDEKFLGYAGWNTTGNTLGSALSAAINFYLSRNVDVENFKRLQAVRLLDDWAYQANIRKIIRDNNETDIETIKMRFGCYKEKIEKFLGTKIEAKYSFPWHRTFEIGIELK